MAMRINRTVRSVSVLSIRSADPIIAAANAIEMMMLVYMALFEVILFCLVVDDGHLLLPLLPGVIICSHGSNGR